MFKNYLKTAIRNLLRYKGFAVINIASLTIGIIGCLAIGLFVWDEWQYDKNIPGGETAILIALITVSFQAIRAAIANPVKSLRTE